MIPYLSGTFEWKNLKSSISYDSSATTGATTLARLDLEMTLLVDKPGVTALAGHKGNKFWLNDVAFEPKQFSVTIEEGAFWHPSLRAHLDQKHLFYTKQCPLQLTFDRSPYPPREEWRNPHTMGLESHKYWERNQFCAGQIK
jgi:hypothetical protein